MEKAEISGLIILFIGVALLLFTFLNAYWFLTRDIGLISTGDLVEAFGESLAPLIATCIRIMYLGIMGWIGSLLTLRGISLLKQKESPSQVKAEKKIQQKSMQVQPKKVEKPVKPQKREESAKQPKEAEVKPVQPTLEEQKETQKPTDQPNPVEEKKEEGFKSQNTL